MAFTWNSTSTLVSKDYIDEVRSNIDYVDSNIACLTNKSNNLSTHNQQYNSTLCTVNRATHYNSYDNGDHGSYDSSDRGSYDGSHKGGHNGSNYPSNYSHNGTNFGSNYPSKEYSDYGTANLSYY